MRDERVIRGHIDEDAARASGGARLKLKLGRAHIALSRWTQYGTKINYYYGKFSSDWPKVVTLDRWTQYTGGHMRRFDCIYILRVLG